MSRSLRRTVDVVGVLMGLAALAVVVLFGTRHLDERRSLRKVESALAEFNRVIAVKAASTDIELSPRGWPSTVDPAWFLGEPPTNVLLSPDRPWVEVATEEQADLMDPPLRIAAESAVAAFWYNPYRGVVRARVPLMVSERESIVLYNRVNGRAVQATFEPLLIVAPPVYETSPENPDDMPQEFWSESELSAVEQDPTL